jgi:hypothetical protein
VIRQNTDRDRFKRISLLNRTICPPQVVDVSHQEVTGSFGKGYREEESATRDSDAPITRHAG